MIITYFGLYQNKYNSKWKAIVFKTTKGKHDLNSKTLSNIDQESLRNPVVQQFLLGGPKLDLRFVDVPYWHTTASSKKQNYCELVSCWVYPRQAKELPKLSFFLVDGVKYTDKAIENVLYNSEIWERSNEDSWQVGAAQV